MNYFRSGQYIKQISGYQSFQPELINKDWSFTDNQMLYLLSKADRIIGRLDMYSNHVDIDQYIRLHIAKEATTSSKIEGTQTNIQDIFLNKDEIQISKRDDWEEVTNYIEAMNHAVEQLHRLPFSSRLIKQTHKILLKGERGTHKQPGEFRNSQNWIGGARLSDATFIPPTHQSISELMSDLEKFANNEDNTIPDLLKIGIIHYQFETIHSFLDGNGRVGRLLITLYLVDKGILKRPVLYLSEFFESNRFLYYDNLMRVRTHNDIEQWLKFFLTGIIAIAQKGVDTFDNILKLKKDLDHQINQMGNRSADARQVIYHLYKDPIVDAKKIMNITGRSSATAYQLIKNLEEMGIIRDISKSQRNKRYIFKDYIRLFE